MPIYRKPTILPSGVYEVKVVDAESRSSKKGNEMIVLKLQTKHDALTHHVRDYLMVAEGAAWKFTAFLRAIGQELPDGATINAADYIGESARAVIDVQQFEGGSQNKVVKWLPALQEIATAN